MGRTSSVGAPCKALTRDLSSAADMAQTTYSLRYVHGLLDVLQRPLRDFGSPRL